MDIPIITAYSYWWALPLVLIPFLAVYWLNIHGKPYHNDLTKPQIILLSILRGAAFFLLLLLLLEPQIKYKEKVISKPILIFAQDNSKSLRYSADSSYYLNQYKKDVEGFLEKAAAKYEIRKISFGDNIKNLSKFDFDDSKTNISELFNFLKKNYTYLDNVQIVLASDGIYNTGTNPRYQAQDLSFPIHTLQLGDTAKIADVAIHSIKSNQIAFVNSKIPVRIGIKATNFENEELIIKIKSGSKVLKSEQLKINNSDFYSEKIHLIATQEPGLQEFAVDVKSSKKELTLRNNYEEFVVDVLDNQRKIGICFDSFHPDIAAIKSAMDKNLNFSSELLDLSRKMPDFNTLNLLVLYQIPSSKSSYGSLLQQIKQREIPVLFVLGGNSDLERLNDAQLGTSFSNNKNLFMEAAYVGNEGFSLFEISTEKQKSLENLPPLVAPFGDYNFDTGYQILGFQKIKSIQTTSPLFAFTTQQNQKTAWIFGEGLWRWKLHLFRKDGNHENFNELINRVVQYLALKVKPNQLIVKHSKNYAEADEIVFEAELYNKSYQLINKPDLEFVLLNEDNKSFKYKFEKTIQSYRLNINLLPKGKYKYQVKTIGFKQELNHEGLFIVSFDNTEAKNLQADRNLLYQIAHETGGVISVKNETDKILNYIMEDNNSKPVVYEKITYGGITNMFFVLILITIFMILEWFLRKLWLGT